MPRTAPTSLSASEAPETPEAPEDQAWAASTSARRPVARSRTKPRTASVWGMKGEALIWAIDWRTLSARLVKAPGAQVGGAPASPSCQTEPDPPGASHGVGPAD